MRASEVAAEEATQSTDEGEGAADIVVLSDLIAMLTFRKKWDVGANKALMITEADHILQSHLNSKVTPSIAPIAWSEYASFVAKKSGTVLGITIVSCRACTMARIPLIRYLCTVE
ncbi:hypothetical protein GQ600_18066 [Phytophthora cactorum]|nr:hypothetical protein GQ600_18066 [Phytophthora cactorum]